MEEGAPEPELQHQSSQQDLSQEQLKVQRVRSFVLNNEPAYRSKFMTLFLGADVEPAPPFKDFNAEKIESFYDDAFAYRSSSEDLQQQITQMLEDHITANGDSPFTFDSVMQFFYTQILSIPRIKISVKEQQQPSEPEIPSNQFQAKKKPPEQEEDKLRSQPVFEQQIQEVKVQELEEIEYDEKTVEMRLKNIFDFYCRSIQMNVGYAVTFDKIKQECEMMTLSKMIQFLHQYELITANLSTAIARTIFKKVSNNLKEIGFDKFKDMIHHFAEVEFGQHPASYSHYLQRMNLLSQRSYRRQLRKLNIPITANKMEPLDKEHHQKMLENILRKKKRDPNFGAVAPPSPQKKEKINAQKKKKKDSKKIEPPGRTQPEQKKEDFEEAFRELMQYDADDDLYMREFKIEGSMSSGLAGKLERGQSVVQSVKKRALQEQKRSKRY